MPFGPDEARGVEDDARPARIDLDHRPALDVDAVLARLAVRGDRCARSESARRACRAARRTVGYTGAACANSGNTTSRTGRNGALPATAESIIDSMRSVFARICARSSGLARSVWQAAAAYRMIVGHGSSSSSASACQAEGFCRSLHVQSRSCNRSLTPPISVRVRLKPDATSVEPLSPTTNRRRHGVDDARVVALEVVAMRLRARVVLAGRYG